jgi:very-short-patch-repair endonuclease
MPIAGYIADFACPQAKLIIELDGGQHQEQMQYDAARSRALAASGYRVLRYWNNAVMLEMESVVADIHRELTERLTPPQPSPSLREREGAKAPAPSLSPQAKGRAGEGCS